MKKQRKHYTPEEKVAILRRHLLEQVPVPELCDRQGLQPALFYHWQKEFFENGAAAFQKRGDPPIPRSRSESIIWRRRSRPRTRSWPS
jgi:transposase